LTDVSTNTTPKRSRAPKGQGDKLRNDILRATERLLVETGDEAEVSMRAIAEAVGCTPPSIYLHFADKEELIFEVCNARWAEFNELLDTAGEMSDDPLESLRHRGLAYIRFGVENPEHYRLLMMTKTDEGHADIEDLTKQGAVAFQHLVGAVARCVEAGVFRDIDPYLGAIVMWAGVHGITSLLVTSPNFPWPDRDVTINALLDAQVLGLATR
jgi:AcrR family transcriptional regulator